MKKRATKLEKLINQAKQYDFKMLSRALFIEDHKKENKELVIKAADTVFNYS